MVYPFLMNGTYLRRRTKEDYLNPPLHFCSWLTRDSDRENRKRLREFLGKTSEHKNTTKKETVKKPDRRFYHLRDDSKAYLVLYIPIISDGEGGVWENKRETRFREPGKWHYIFHQTAGFACHSHYLHARFLSPTPKVEKLMEELLKEYNDSCISGPRLSEAAKYNEILQKFGLSAEGVAFDLEEGFYPVDIECLSKVTREKFPKDLQNLIIPSKSKKLFSRFLDRRNFQLAILGPNCD